MLTWCLAGFHGHFVKGGLLLDYHLMPENRTEQRVQAAQHPFSGD